MSLALTFGDKKLLDSPILGPDGAVCYTTSTTHGFRGRKITTIMTASGLVGIINWREKTFTLNGVQRKWDDLKSRSNGIFSSEREWNWANRPYKLKYHNWEKELLVTPSFGSAAGAVRFTPYHVHLLHDNEPAVLYFPHQMDEVERMFLLMVILQTEIHRRMNASNAAVAGAAASAS
ncbi:hypothetical protein FB451DRAFT_1566702 [Mycena latifolia]|nr:hypothetical protein FB451DRAFT_1566702 [Mycena latifolia]